MRNTEFDINFAILNVTIYLLPQICNFILNNTQTLKIIGLSHDWKYEHSIFRKGFQEKPNSLGLIHQVFDRTNAPFNSVWCILFYYYTPYE